MSAELSGLAAKIALPPVGPALHGWQKLASEAGHGLAIAEGRIIAADPLAIQALKAAVERAAQGLRQGKVAIPWMWMLPVYQEIYTTGVLRRAEQQAREAALNAPPPHVLREQAEREAEQARRAAMTQEQRDAEDAKQQADLDRILRRSPREVPHAA
jgi:hypothetical protein